MDSKREWRELFEKHKEAALEKIDEVAPHLASLIEDNWATLDEAVFKRDQSFRPDEVLREEEIEQWRKNVFSVDTRASLGSTLGDVRFACGKFLPFTPKYLVGQLLQLKDNIAAASFWKE